MSRPGRLKQGYCGLCARVIAVSVEPRRTADTPVANRWRYDFEQLVHSRKSYEWLLEAKTRHAKLLLEEEERQREANKQLWDDMSNISAKANTDE
jgi:hypothetical protein